MMKKTILLVLVALFALSVNAQEKKDFANELLKRFTFAGYGQFGWEYHSESDPSQDFLINKLIGMAHLRITDQFSAFTMFDFKGGTLHELWLSYDPQPWLKIKVGEFKTPYTLENPINPAEMETITQMSLAGTWMIAGGDPLMMPGGAGRDLGVTVYGDLPKNIASYDLALMNGAGRNKRDNDSWKDFVARLTFHPTKSFDVGGSMILGHGKCVENLWVDGANLSDGRFHRNRYAASAQLKTAPVNVRAEYMWGKDGDENSDGGYVTVQVNNVAKNFDIVASADHLDTRIGELNRLQAGAQYWFYPKCRIQAAYTYTDVKHGEAEHGILTQLQVAF